MLVKIKPESTRSAAREESVLPSGNLQAPGLSAEAAARIANSQPRKICENPPDQETAGLKVSIPDPDSVVPQALDANNVGPIDRMANASDDVEIESHEANELISSSDDESVHQRLKDGIPDDPGSIAECEHRHSTGAVLDGNDGLIASKFHHSINAKLALIESQVLEALSADEAGQYRASIKIQWNILGFMDDQFREDDFPNSALSPVVTISGSAQHAQATTCSDYIQQNWPAHGSKVLDALQAALDSPSHTSQSKICDRIDDGNISRDGAPSSHAELEFQVTRGSTSLYITSGNPDIVVDVVQQLAWMGAALRTSGDGRIEYCDSKLEAVLRARGVAPAILKLTFDMNSPSGEDQSCWFPLFTNPVIAYGFPTVHRNDHEVGLEIPLEMMAALGGARHAVDFEGGLVLKGYSVLFVPIRVHEESVQWHLICARDEERIPYREASVQCPNRVFLKDLNHEALRTTRAYLGWWKEAETHLGTADADYESIDWSKAKEAGPPPRLTGGTVGVSKIISAQVNFVLGAKDGSFHYSQHEPFQKTVDRSENLPVVLYDQKDRRSWLVPALPVILHIIQLRHHIKPFVVDGEKVKISPLDPSQQGFAAREAVTKNKSQKLFDCESNEEKEYCFRDAVLDTWSILDRLMEREATTQATPGMAIHATWQSTLHGWEFRAVADEDRHLKQKSQVLEKSAGRWYDLVKDVDAIVLFASGLGDIIKPRSGLGGLCRKWRSLPKDKDYLAVGVSMLRMFYAKAGHRQDQQYLTSAKLQWHRGSMLFESCAGVGSNRCKCDRLQQVYHDSYKIIGHRIPHGKLEANGCVVFGQGHHPLKLPQSVAWRQNTVHMLPNASIQDGRTTKKTSTEDDGSLSPSPPTSVSPEPEEVNGNAIRSPKQRPSPLSFTDHLVQEKAIASKRRRKTPHMQASSFDMCKGPNDSNDQIPLSDDCATCPLEYQSILRYDNLSNGQYSGCRETIHAPKAEDAPSHAPKTLRHKAKIENYSHRGGCSCTTCSTGSFEPPESMELVNTVKGIRRNSTNIAKMPNRQLV
ncbi:hypothetical protein HO133_003163 [Letharia lupina]|uniref:Uncharacterized protein n=1 Tax=Letharia lupina TaxID=560253 RepID=A0A8H6FA19_9LECA|nr:uncharacterized protein HO133_003163 [Letharia lupina]KAF6220730.1 hypothetical protein HO133_003163 [Letharia lupina]